MALDRDHVLIFGEQHLRQILYSPYYNAHAHGAEEGRAATATCSTNWDHRRYANPPLCIIATRGNFRQGHVAGYA
jgi:hypothetical protein